MLLSNTLIILSAHFRKINSQFVYKLRYALNSHSSEDYSLEEKAENPHAAEKNGGKKVIF